MSRRPTLNLPPDAPLFISARQAEALQVGWSRLSGPAGHRQLRGIYRTRAVDAPAGATDPAEVHAALLRALQWAPGEGKDIASHESAAFLGGCPDVAAPDSVHLTSIAGDRRRRLPGTTGHRGKVLPTEVVERDGVVLTNPAHTWLDLAATAWEDQLVVWGDWLVHPVWGGDWDAVPFTTPKDLELLLTHHRGRPGIRRARAALDRVRVGSDSPRETLLRLALVDAGLPEPAVNLPIRDAQGRIIHQGDLVYEEFRTTLEYEGRHHSDPDQVARDIARHEALAAHDWLELRFSARLAQDNWRPAIRKVRQGLRSRGWHG